LSSDDSDVFCAQFCANGNVIYYGSRDGNVRTFDLRTGPGHHTAGSNAALMQQRSSVSSIIVENDFELLVSSHFGTVQRWDVRTCRATPDTLTVPGHNPILALGMCATSDIHMKQCARIPLIATASSQGSVQLWPLRGLRAGSRPLRSFPVGSSRALCVRFDDEIPSGKLASLWSLSDGLGLIKSAV
jgi:WD40 repeat protein